MMLCQSGSSFRVGMELAAPSSMSGVTIHSGALTATAGSAEATRPGASGVGEAASAAATGREAGEESEGTGLPGGGGGGEDEGSCAGGVEGIAGGGAESTGDEDDASARGDGDDDTAAEFKCSMFA